MSKNWYNPRTKEDKSRFDKGCRTIHDYYGSYPRIAAGLKHITGIYVSGQTVRMWFLNRDIPIHYAIVLADAVEISPFDLVPWMEPYALDWMQRSLLETAK